MDDAGKRCIEDAAKSMLRFASDYVTATSRSGMQLCGTVFVARNIGGQCSVAPLTAAQGQHGMPYVSDIVGSLERQFATRSIPMAIAFVSFGAAKRTAIDEPMRSVAMIHVADVLGRSTSWMRHWVADGPIGDWTENKDSSFVRDILKDSLTLACQQFTYLRECSRVQDHVDAMQYGADVSGDEQASEGTAS
jgi:hypothetical protein